MTAQKAQIESLIQELDEILDKTAPRLPWLTPNDATKQRQVLEQTRRYLVSLQQGGSQITESSVLNESGAAETVNAETVNRGLPQTAASPEVAFELSPISEMGDRSIQAQTAPPAPVAAQAEVVESAQQALQAVVQEMNYLRSNLLQPIRSDLEVLQRQRETLLQEIRKLETQRQQYALPQNPQQNQLLMEFLQAAFRQMQENLSAQVNQMMATLGTQAPGAVLPEPPNFSSGSSDLMALSPSQRLEQMQRVQTQSDQLLLKLDSSLRIIFNSLQQNVETYQDSLEQGLSRMHNLGQQGEAMFAALVTRLAEQLGREASTFLQSSIEPGTWEPDFPSEGLSVQERAAGQARPTAPSPAKTAPTATDAAESDISRLLDELNELDAAQPVQANQPFANQPFVKDVPPTHADRWNVGGLSNLDSLDLDLNQLDLDAFSPEPFAIADEDLTVFQDEPLDAFLSTDLTVMQDDSEPEILQTTPEAKRIPSPEFSDDPSEVLDLLNQIRIESEADLTELQPDAVHQDAMKSGSLEAIDPVSSPAPGSPLVTSPDTLYEDEFYQSLFGDDNPQPLTPEDLFADVEMAEPGEAVSPVAPSDSTPDHPALLDLASVDSFEVDPTQANLTDLPDISLSSSVQENWFSGLGESEDAPEDQTTLQIDNFAIVEVPELPQTVENVLLPTTELQPPMPIDRASGSPNLVIPEQVDADLPESIESAQKSPETIESVTETIGSLLDLIPFVPSDTAAPNSASLAVEEHGFELAQPGEDLLTDEPSHRETLTNLKLSSNTLEQLAQDLSTLEGSDETFTLSDTADWILADEPSEAPPFDAPPEPVPFTDFFDEPLSPSESSEQIPPPDSSEDLFAAELFSADPDSTPSTPPAPSEAQPAGWDLFENQFEDEGELEGSIEPLSSPFEESASEEATQNAFTLEGLDSLFENLSVIPSSDPDESAEPLLDAVNGSEFNDLELQPSVQSNFLDPVTTGEETGKKKALDDSALQDDIAAVTLDAESDKGAIVESDLQESKHQLTLEGALLEETSLKETSLKGTLGDFVTDLLQFPPAIGSETTEWHLGLDIGTTGISAVLLNRSTGQLHPIYWQSPASAITLAGNAEPSGQSAPATENPAEPPAEKQFRLPLAVSLMPSGQDGAQNSLIRDFKPYLNLTLPYDFESPDDLSISEPVLSWSDDLPILLVTLRQAFQALITPLVMENPAAAPACGAVDLKAEDLAIALHQLVGVVVSIPAGWSEAYRFNVREALLAAELVERPEQIFFLEESIATILAAFAGSSRSPLKMPQGQALQDIEWHGHTLILCAGATQTELALVQLPSRVVENAASPYPSDIALAKSFDSPQPNLTHADFQIQTLAYAGTAIDQDIITQLIYPLLPNTDPTRAAMAQLSLPAVGEPDGMKREALQKQLRRTKAGRSLIETARILKLNLQQQTQFVIQIADTQSTLLRQDLTTKVLLPYVQRLNRELNMLLNQTQIPALDVRQVVCTGGTASLGALTRWLQQKLPNALILQDAYPWARSINYIPTCSRVAYGLAALPFYPSVLDRAKHQYSDFFLLLQLIRNFPSWAMTLEEVLEMLQHKGIDAAACRSRILSILEGKYPSGLIPSESEMNLLTFESQWNPLYQEFRRTPIFYRELYPDGVAYRINPHHLSELNRYYDLVLSHTHQPLNEPYSIALNADVQSPN